MATHLSPTRRLPLALLLTLLAAVWTLLTPAQFGGQAVYVMVTGNSMEPTLHNGDLAILHHAERYQIGQIVTYSYPGVGKVIHRIIGRDGPHYIMKGDNNSWVDSHHPTEDQLLGTLSWRLPLVGRLIGMLRAPWMFALLAFCLTWSLLAMKPLRTQTATPRLRPAAALLDSYKEPLLLILAVLAFASLALTLLAFTRPLTRSATEDLSYTQRGTFSYSAPAPAGVYDTAEARTGEPIFRRLSDTLDVRFHYRASAEPPLTLSGSSELIAELGDASGWKRTLPLAARTSFTTTSFDLSGQLKLVQLDTLIADIQRLTGVERERYTLTIVPRVTGSGSLAGQPFEADFAPRLVFEVDPLQLQLRQAAPREADPLLPVQSGSVQRTLTEPNRLQLFGLSIAVSTARWLPLFGALLAGAGALALGLRMRQIAQADEATRIQFKYGALIVPVYDQPNPPREPLVRVATIDELARLAEREDRLIMTERRGDAWHYVVESGAASYHYQAETGGAA